MPRRYNVDVSRRSLTDSQTVEVAAAYAAGEPAGSLADRYGVSTQLVYRSIKRAGGTAERGGTWRGTPEQRAEVIRLYVEGASVHDLSHRYRCRTTVVSAVLAEEGVPLHPGGRKHPKFTARQEVEVATAYTSGEAVESLAERYGVSTRTIRNVLQRQGVDARPAGRAVFWTTERLDRLRALHAAGTTQPHIASMLGTSTSSVNRRLMILGEVAPKPRNKGPKHPSWKGGRSKNGEGYILAMVTDADRPYCTPNASGYVLEHRLVMGRALGRPLTRAETVHHINGDKTDNRLENLQLRQGKHGSGVEFRCRSCGSHDVEAVPLST